MLTKKQKSLLENKIYRLIKESMFENGFGENMYYEKKSKDDSEEEHKNHKMDDGERHDGADSAKEDTVIDWLDNEQELHSVLSYELYPDKASDGEAGRGAARSLFSKKYRGEDNNGKSYDFSPEEINKLYNLRDDFLTDIGAKKS